MREELLSTLRLLGSGAVTLFLIVFMALVVAASLIAGLPVADWIAPVAVGFGLNLAAALVTHATLRAQPMLFAFHAVLLLLMGLIAADRLTSLKGHVEITEGAIFDPSLAVLEMGPLHAYALDRIVFVQGPFDIRYAPGMKRRETTSHIRIRMPDGRWREMTVGDDEPLEFGDYRFYTSFNKGFAPVLTFTDRSGRSVTGAVHLPSYPLNAHRQGNSWTPPGSNTPIKLWLRFPSPVYDEHNNWSFRKPADPELTLIDGERRVPLRLGDTAEIGAGTVRFDGVRSWMGYTIAAGTLAPWMLAVGLVACLTLATHVWGKTAETQARRPARHVEVRHVD